MSSNPPLSEKLTCAICANRGDNRTHVAREMMFGLRDEFRYLECEKCGCLQLIDVPQDMSKYYPENYYSFAPTGGLEAAIERLWAGQAHGEFSLAGWLLDRLIGPHVAMSAIRRARIPPDARVLDVGCGAGLLIRDMKRLGYRNVSGIDPYIKGDMRGSDGVVVLKKSLQEMTGEFDLVMFNHSFEHIADQAGTLDQVHRLLSPVGRALIRIPIVDSFAWKHYGINWVHLDAPRHLFLHSPASLRLLAEKSGLYVENLTYEGNASQFVGSEQYARDVALVDQRKGGKLRRLQELRLARSYRARVEELNRNAQGDWGCFELRASKQA